MKVSAIVAVTAAAAGAAAQAIPDGTPDCVATCAKNMLGKADLGCAANDVACLCRNPNFAYGIHDCTWANCAYNQDQLDLALKWAAGVCAGVSVTIPTITDTPPAPTTDGSAGAGTSTAGAGTPTAVTTSLFTTTITDAAGAVITQTGSTVLSGLNGTPGASVVATTLTGTLVATGDGFTSTLPTTFGTSVTVAPTDATPVSSDVAESTTSSGLGAHFTAAPAAGFFAAAGLAAFLL